MLQVTGSPLIIRIHQRNCYPGFMYVCDDHPGNCYPGFMYVCDDHPGNLQLPHCGLIVRNFLLTFIIQFAP